MLWWQQGLWPQVLSLDWVTSETAPRWIFISGKSVGQSCSTYVGTGSWSFISYISGSTKSTHFVSNFRGVIKVPTSKAEVLCVWLFHIHIVLQMFSPSVTYGCQAVCPLGILRRKSNFFLPSFVLDAFDWPKIHYISLGIGLNSLRIYERRIPKNNIAVETGLIDQMLQVSSCRQF